MTGTTTDTFTRTINSVDADGFVDQDTFGSGAVRTGQWRCNSGNLIALDPLGSTSANVQVNGNTTDFQTTAQDGVTLPASVAVGDSWTQSVSISGTITTNDISAEATNDVSISCSAAGMESVTVPAGTFDAMKIHCQDNMTITVTVAGASIPTSLSFGTDSWYAPGVGWVKSVSTGSDLDTQIVLTAYSLP